MAIEEPSVVAAASSIAKFVSPFSFKTSSSPSVMIGQIHLPHLQPQELHTLEKIKTQLIGQLNESCPSMTQRKGGVKEIRLRNIDSK
jgi:hydroxymethylglutaryl-CoA reductase